MPIAEANGQQLYYEVHGEGDPLLCVMGLGTDHLAWILQVPVWSQSRRVIVFDNRDVGQSSYADGDYEVADMAADALALADVLELDSFDLLGLSLGGAISQQIALTAPERIRTLTLAVTYGGLGRWGEARARMFRRFVERMSPEEHVDNLMYLCFSEDFFEKDNWADAVRQAMLANPHPQRPEGFVRQLETGSRHELRARLSEIELPTHVIGGDRDLMVPFWKSEELAELIPDAKLTTLRSGHAVNVEAAEAFNAAVLDFIAERSPAPA